MSSIKKKASSSASQNSLLGSDVEKGVLGELSSVNAKISSPTKTNDNNANETKENTAFSRSLKLLFCFIGLQVSYIAWGVSQEQLMTNEYKTGKFKSASFCVFANRFFALFLSLAIVMYKQMTSTAKVKEAPYHYYAPASLSNSISSWAQYEALKYVSFPTQVLSKSCKVIPVMLVSQ